MQGKHIPKAAKTSYLDQNPARVLNNTSMGNAEDLDKVMPI